MTPDEQHELDCLRARVAQIAYPCSPHCDGYLRELATRNTTGFLAEPDDAWAERYCTYVGWEPDGSQVSFNSDGMASISFREMAKNHIKAAQQAWLSTRAETAQSSEVPRVSPSEASAGNLAQDEPNYKALYTELKGEVLEKVGPFARLGELIGQYQDYRKGRGLVPAEVNSFGEAFRALSSLHGKLSSIEVFPELPSDGGSSNRSMGLNAVPSTALAHRIGERIADEVERAVSGRQTDCESAATDILAMIGGGDVKNAAGEAEGSGAGEP